MRIEIDFDKKVIKIAEKANFKAVMDFIQTLPNWQEFFIDTNTQIVYQSNPIYIDRWHYPYWHSIPTWCYGTSSGITSSGDFVSNLTVSNSTAAIGAATFTSGTHQFDLSEN